MTCRTKHVAFAAASGLRSDWNEKSRADKAAPRKHASASVEITAGGLNDSDIDDTNSYAKDAAGSLKASITEEQLEEASKNATRDVSRKNNVRVE